MKFSGYCFYMNANMKGDFQICISVPLKLKLPPKATKGRFDTLCKIMPVQKI